LEGRLLPDRFGRRKIEPWRQAGVDAWLDPMTPAGDLNGILSHDIDGSLQFYRLGREVNESTINKLPNDHAGLTEPIKLF